MRTLAWRSSGFLIIEVVVTIAIVLTVVASVLTLYTFVINSERRENAKLQGSLLAQEALEATDFVARYDWNQMQNGTWHPEMIGGVWKLAAASEVLDGKYTRSIVIDPVSRSSASNGHAFGSIVASGGTDDPETKLVTVTVSWNYGLLGDQSIQHQMYQARDESRLFRQLDWSGGPGQTDFLDTSKFATGENVDYSAKGVLSLAGNYITWDNATTTAEFDLPSNIDAEAIFVVGSVLYIGSQNNSSGGPSGHEFYAFDISSLDNPVLLDSYDVGASVYAIHIRPPYAALATSEDSGELQIFNIADPQNMQLVRTINLPSNDDSVDVDLSGDYLYIIQGSIFYTFDNTDPTNPIQTDAINLGGAVLNALSMKGTKAFVSSSIDNKEFIILDVTDPVNAQEIAIYDLPGNRQAIDVYAFGFFAHVATSNSGSEPEYYIFNITNPFQPQLLGTYEIGENLFAVSALSNFAFVGSGRNGQDILVLDITDPANILLETGYEVKGTATDIYPTPEAIYLATTSNDSELVIISVNSNVPLYSASGFAESSTFDTQSPTSTLNWIDWLGEALGTTSVKFQIASNNDTATWVYKGPDGTTNSYYTTTTRDLINYQAHLNNRYVRYKVYLDSANQESSPFVYQIDLNYSQ